MGENDKAQDTPKPSSGGTAKPPKAEAPEVSAQTGDTYPVEDLIARAPGYLGLPTYVAAGGLHGTTGELSIVQARQQINDWLDKPLEA